MPSKTTNGRRNLVPAQLNNRQAKKHGAYLSRFTPAELAEIAALEDEIRALVVFPRSTSENCRRRR